MRQEILEEELRGRRMNLVAKRVFSVHLFIPLRFLNHVNEFSFKTQFLKLKNKGMKVMYKLARERRQKNLNKTVR